MSWLQEPARVVTRTQLDETVTVLLLNAPRIAEMIVPGQFVMLHPPTSPYLPRAMAPLSWDSRTGILSIVVRIVGPGTRELQALAPGDEVDITGPLGTALPFAPGPWALVGRGVGIAPLLPWAHALAAANQEVRFYLSARRRDLLLAEQEFRELGQLTRHLDEEKTGHLVTDDLLRDMENGWKPEQILVCGSRRLTEGTVEIQRRFPVNASVLLEEKMACGIGWCKGCASGEQWALLCVDGPTRPLIEGVIQ